MNKVRKNYIIYTIYQIILLSFPLITFPYVSKILGVENYGLYDYSYAVLNYFLMFAKLGIINYGTREVAENSNDSKSLVRIFKDIYFTQFILTTLVLLIYILSCFVFYKDNLLFNVLYSLFIIANYFDISWFYQGVQKFNNVAIKNLFINVFSFPLIFMFIKTSDDLIIYLLIMTFAHIFGNLITWISLKDYFSFYEFVQKYEKHFSKHFIGMLVLFAPILATNIYNFMDEIILGNLSVFGEVGLYTCGEKIMYIPLAIVTPLSSMMLPYISQKKSNKEKLNKGDREKILLFTVWIAVSISFGLLYIAPQIINLFFSEEYKGAIIIIQIMSLYTFFYILSVLFRDVYYLPDRKDKTYVLTVCIEIPICLLLNLLLVPKMGALGATVSMTISAFIILLLRIYIVRKEIDWKYIYRDLIIFIMSAFLMYVTLSVFELKVGVPIIDFVIDIVLGVLVYLMLTGDRLFRIIKMSTKKG